MSTKSDDGTAPTSEGGSEDVTVSDVKNMLQTQITDSKGKKKSVWAMSMETMGMAGGKEGEGDLYIETVDEGVIMLKRYIKEKDAKLAEEQATAKKKLPFNSWMDIVPLEEFHVTQTLFLKAFIKWSIKDKEDIVEGSEDSKLTINASKARRRIDSYFDWMKDNMAEDIIKNPLTVESVLPVQRIWEMQGSHMEDGRYCWWFDIGQMDHKKLKELPAQEHLRYVVWWSHLVMFDTKAQDNGIVLVEDLDMIGFWSCMTLIPMDLSAKMDRLTIGVLPVKMKGIYMFGCARWMHLMMALMKPFLSKKMRERMIVVSVEAEERQKYCDDLIGRNNIVDGFMKLQGDVKPDYAIERFKKKIKKKEKKAAEKEKEASK